MTDSLTPSRMTELKPGQRIKDNDPRMGSRYLRILEVLPNGVLAEHPISRRVFSILRKSIHTDGKPRRSGFSLLQAEEENND